jgi:Tfp pilus assembly protein PilF
MAWLPGQRSVAVADNVNHRVIIAAVDPTNGSGDDSIVLPSRHGRITNLAVSPDGRWVAAGGWKESGIQIWNLPKRRLETVRRAGDSKTGARFWVYFSPDNRWLVSAVVSDESCTYVAYSVGSWQRAWSQAAELETNPGVAFSADGRSMALSMSPTQVLIADPYDGRELVRMTSGEPHYALPAAFSDEASEVVLNPGFRPMAWWNLIRLRDRLTQLGLAWEHQSERAEYEERETLPAASHATASTDGWSVKDSPAVRRKLFIDLGDFSPSNRANDKTSVAENHVRLGRFLLETGNWASALSAFDCALELTPNNATMHNNLAWLVATCPNPGQPQVAWSLKAAARAVELEPANASFHNTLGVALYRDGQWQAAITQLTIAEELAPGKWFAHNTLFLAMTNWRLGDQPTARDWYSKAVTWLEQNSTAQHDEELARFRAEAEAMLAIQPEASRSTP